MSLPRLVTDLFRLVAIEESDIERLRQTFATMREFTMNQRALFEAFDISKDGKITADELLKFLVDNFHQHLHIGFIIE